MARGSWNFKQCQSCRFMLKKIMPFPGDERRISRFRRNT
jgi:hypothetical protein